MVGVLLRFRVRDELHVYHWSIRGNRPPIRALSNSVKALCKNACIMIAQSDQATNKHNPSHASQDNERHNSDICHVSTSLLVA